MTRATEPAAATGAGVRLSAALPKNDANGLRPIAQYLVNEPRLLRYAVIAYDVARLIDDVDADIDTAVVRVQRIEPLFGDESYRALELLEAAAKARANDGQIPFDDDPNRKDD